MRTCTFCPKPLKPNNKCGACYVHKHLSEKIKGYQHVRRTKTTFERAQYSAMYRKSNREHLLSEKRIWSREYRIANPDKHRQRVYKRNAAILRATPKWLTKEQRSEMKLWHLLRKDLQWLSEELLTVDHIIPIGGKAACGLHVPWNLQILPKSINCSKSTRLVG